MGIQGNNLYIFIRYLKSEFKKKLNLKNFKKIIRKQINNNVYNYQSFCALKAYSKIYNHELLYIHINNHALLYIHINNHSLLYIHINTHNNYHKKYT